MYAADDISRQKLSDALVFTLRVNKESSLGRKNSVDPYQMAYLDLHCYRHEFCRSRRHTCQGKIGFIFCNKVNRL